MHYSFSELNISVYMLAMQLSTGPGFCSEETVYGMSWPWTSSGETVEMRCPGERNNRTAARECRDGKWVDTGTCFTFGETLVSENLKAFQLSTRLNLPGTNRGEYS